MAKRKGTKKTRTSHLNPAADGATEARAATTSTADGCQPFLSAVSPCCSSTAHVYAAAQRRLPPSHSEQASHDAEAAPLARALQGETAVYGGAALPWPMWMSLQLRTVGPGMHPSVQQARKASVSIAQMPAYRTSVQFSMPPSLAGTRKSRWKGSPADDRALRTIHIADILGCADVGVDKVYEGHVLTVMVVAAPAKLTALQTAVEDCTRDAMVLSLYDLPPEQQRLWVIGRVLRIRNPYLRFSQGGVVCLRVDYPAETVELQGLTRLCWFCLRVETAGVVLKQCRACNQARYCSVECQREDWKENGHKFMCPKLAAAH